MASYECSICSCQLHTTNPRMFYCSKCWKKWQSAIEAKSEWTRFLQNNEAQRRQYGSYTKNGKRVYASFVYLGSEWDIYGNKLVPLTEHFTEET